MYAKIDSNVLEGIQQEIDEIKKQLDETSYRLLELAQKMGRVEIKITQSDAATPD